MNEDITRFLDSYVELPSPGYAVMLNGEWGCGKTFFIKKWLETNEQSCSYKTPCKLTNFLIRNNSKNKEKELCQNRYTFPFTANVKPVKS